MRVGARPTRQRPQPNMAAGEPTESRQTLGLRPGRWAGRFGPSAALRACLGCFATGVAIVTVEGPDGSARCHGELVHVRVTRATARRRQHRQERSGARAADRAVVRRQCARGGAGGTGVRFRFAFGTLSPGGKEARPLCAATRGCARVRRSARHGPNTTTETTRSSSARSSDSSTEMARRSATSRAASPPSNARAAGSMVETRWPAASRAEPRHAIDPRRARPLGGVELHFRAALRNGCGHDGLRDTFFPSPSMRACPRVSRLSASRAASSRMPTRPAKTQRSFLGLGEEAGDVRGPALLC
jgi:hypothetical protein